MAYQPFNGDVVSDGATARLLATAQATELAGILPSASGRTLVRQAKAVRLFVQARDVELARQTLDLIDKSMIDCEAPELIRAIKRKTSGVRKALRHG